VLAEGGQCVQMPSYEEADFAFRVKALTTMWSDAILREQVAEAAGVELSKARSARVDLTCWFGNRSVTGAVCLDASNRGASCAQRMEWSGAGVSLLVSGVIWGLVTLIFVFSFGSFFRRREVKWRHERLRILKSSVHLDLWRFLVQRDLREEQARPPLPTNACIRPDAPANATHRRGVRSGVHVPRVGALPSALTATEEVSPPSDRKRVRSLTAGQPRRSLSVLRRQGSERGRLIRSKDVAGAPDRHDNTDSAPILSAHALMYLPPLTVYLLHSNHRDTPKNCSSKMLESHTKHSEEVVLSSPSPRTRLLPAAPLACLPASTGSSTGTAASTGTHTSPGLCGVQLASLSDPQAHPFADASDAREARMPGSTRVCLCADEGGGGSSSAFSVVSSAEDDATRRV